MYINKNVALYVNKNVVSSYMAEAITEWHEMQIEHIKKIYWAHKRLITLMAEYSIVMSFHSMECPQGIVLNSPQMAKHLHLVSYFRTWKCLYCGID